MYKIMVHRQIGQIDSHTHGQIGRQGDVNIDGQNTGHINDQDKIIKPHIKRQNNGQIDRREIDI